MDKLQTAHPKVYPALEGPTEEDYRAAHDFLYPNMERRIYTAEERRNITLAAHQRFSTRKGIQ